MSYIHKALKNKRGGKMDKDIIIKENFYTQLVSDTSVERAVLSKEKSVEVNNVLNSLNEKYSSLLIFKYEIDLSYKEIAALLGLNEDMVKTYLYRARNKFKEEWNKIYE
ncbi:MAG: sigma-70 family RNA polymerase sigma factor [Clostridium cadaveris]|uniref:sigma-70 family RNA polymerase sigma factor n=1 Tax=Clostridium cadaveris TaxID=1529 RepID=UPI002A88DD15|nr:sigma-70 family RNA polymerase sigma factor [Clostridium cadaveris]